MESGKGGKGQGEQKEKGKGYEQWKGKRKGKGQGPCWKCGGEHLQRDCPRYQTSWGGAGYQAISLDDSATSFVSSLTAIEPAKEKKMLPKAELRNGARFFLWQSGDTADEDDDEDSGTAGATTTRDVTCVRGFGFFAGARAVSNSIGPGVDTSAHRKSFNVVDHITQDNERDEARDAISRNVAINACGKGQNSKRSDAVSHGRSDTTSYNATISACEKGQNSETNNAVGGKRGDTISHDATISACETGQHTATTKACPCTFHKARPGILGVGIVGASGTTKFGTSHSLDAQGPGGDPLGDKSWYLKQMKTQTKDSRHKRFRAHRPGNLCQRDGSLACSPGPIFLRAGVLATSPELK